MAEEPKELLPEEPQEPLPDNNQALKNEIKSELKQEYGHFHRKRKKRVIYSTLGSWTFSKMASYPLI